MTYCLFWKMFVFTWHFSFPIFQYKTNVRFIPLNESISPTTKQDDKFKYHVLSDGTVPLWGLQVGRKNWACIRLENRRVASSQNQAVITN